MIGPMTFLMAQVPPPTKPPTAEKIISQIASSFCVPGGDKMTQMNTWSMPTWRVLSYKVKKGIDFAVDGLVPEHDSYEWTYVGLLRGGQARVSFSYIDHKQENMADHSTAQMTLGLEHVIDQPMIERLLSVRLERSGTTAQRLDPKETQVLQAARMGKPPYTRYMEHFRDDPAVEYPLSISATRTWVNGVEQQGWSIICSTYRPPRFHTRP